MRSGGQVTGTGKTEGILRAIAGRAGDLLAHGSVLMFVPGHVHAEEALARFREMAPGVPAGVIRGRGALHPDDKQPMCRRAKEARVLGGLGAPVRPSLCEARSADGSMRQADCRFSCHYFAQFEALTPGVVFLPHAYMQAEPGDLAPVSLRVIDEAFHQTLSYSRRLDPLGWIDGSAPSAADRREEPALECVDMARMAVWRALRAEASPIEALRACRVDGAALDAIIAFEERNAVAELGVKPWQPDRERQRRIETVDVAALGAARARARIWRILREAIRRETTERLSLASRARPDGASLPAIAFHVRKAPPLDAPLLMLDAEADPLITREFAPHARFLRIDARPNAEAIQLSDRTLSQTWLLDAAQGRDRRGHVKRIILRETGRAAGGVLLVASQAVLEALHRDEDPAFPSGDQAALKRPVFGATPRWFGPGLRGVDAFKGFETVVIVGRLEPAAADIEDAMRAVFGDGDTPLAFLPRVEGRVGTVHRGETTREMADGTTVEARLSSHPDPRGRALLAQVREGGANQAVARLRLVAPDRPNRVLLLSSAPLPDLPVTRLTTWRDLVGGRLRDAIATCDGALRVTRVRLSAAGLAADLPHEFESVEAAEGWRRGRTTDGVMDECRAIAADIGAAVQFVTSRARGQRGRATPMAVFRTGGKVRPVSTGHEA